MDTTIEYIISSNGEISPITPQPGGVLGDDNTVTLSVDLSAITVSENEYIRIDIANGSGGFFSSEHLTVSNGKVTYRLPYEVTSAGGTAQAHLVIVEYDGGVNKIRYSFPMRIYFKDSSAGTAGYALYSKDLSGLMLKTKEEADRANECSAAAQSLMEESQRQANAAANSATAAEAAYSSAADSAVRAASSADNAANYAAAAASKADSAKSSADNAAASEANIANAISAHNTSGEAHGALFGSINSSLSGISGALSAAVEKGNSTADTVALLQKYPSYEYATSGGAVQRFDDVSVIPHNIGVTVHGATDENGNSVTNPTVSVYGANLMPKNYVDGGFNIVGSEWKSGSMPGYQFFPVVYGQKLRLIIDGKAVQCRYMIKDKDKNTIKSLDNTKVADGHVMDINLSNAAYLTFRYLSNAYTEDGVTHEFMLIDDEGDIPDYMDYTEPQTVTVPMTFADGEVCEIGVLNAVSPTMTVIATDDNGLISTVDIKYNRDVKKALDKLEAAIAALA